MNAAAVAPEPSPWPPLAVGAREAGDLVFLALVGLDAVPGFVEHDLDEAARQKLTELRSAVARQIFRGKPVPPTIIKDAAEAVNAAGATWWPPSPLPRGASGKRLDWNATLSVPALWGAEALRNALCRLHAYRSEAPERFWLASAAEALGNLADLLAVEAGAPYGCGLPRPAGPALAAAWRRFSAALALGPGFLAVPVLTKADAMARPTGAAFLATAAANDLAGQGHRMQPRPSTQEQIAAGAAAGSCELGDPTFLAFVGLAAKPGYWGADVNNAAREKLAELCSRVARKIVLGEPIPPTTIRAAASAMNSGATRWWPAPRQPGENALLDVPTMWGVGAVSSALSWPLARRLGISEQPELMAAFVAACHLYHMLCAEAGEPYALGRPRPSGPMLAAGWRNFSEALACAHGFLIVPTWRWAAYEQQGADCA